MVLPDAPFVLVDGSSYLYRAYHALPPLITREGQPTGAIKGVISMLMKLRAQYHPLHMAVVFDAKGRTFRDDLYPEYKAHRPPMPDDLRAQIEPLHAIVRALGLPLLCVDGVEADDVIGTLARIAEQHGLNTVISTGDKDIAQLVNAHTTLVNTMTDTRMDRAGVIEKFGIPPERIVDYLTLVGDSVDNIPGVPGIGPKTAVKLLLEYGDLATLTARATEVKGKVGDNLRAHLPIIPLAHQLASIKIDVDLEASPETLEIRAPDRNLLRAWYSKLEFRQWLSQMENESSVEAANEAEVLSSSAASIDYHTVTDNAALQQLLAEISQAPLTAFDTETTALDERDAHLVGLSFCTRPGHAWYVPVGHDYLGAPEQLPEKYVLDTLRPWLESSAYKKVLQNAKYDINVLANDYHRIALSGVAADTMLESYVLDATATRHDMDSLALKYLSYRTVTFEDIAGKGSKQLTFNQIALDKAAHYACEDADITLRLHDTLMPQLAGSPSQQQVLDHIELPMMSVLARMERIGVLIDASLLRAHSNELGRKLQQLEVDIHALAGEPFNIASPKQLAHILFEKLTLPAPKKTATGQFSTAEDVLENLALDYPLPARILEYRSLAKLKSTYTDRLPEQVHTRTGRVHTSFHQAVAATGRLSSSDPNLQNIPARSEEGRRIRQAFIAPPGCKLLSADYSQIELRIMAHLSNDEGLLSAFAHGEDVHRATAAEVFGVPRDQVSNDMRRHAKAINFGLIYGMSAFGLARQLGLPRNEAQRYIDLYFTRYPGVLDYMERTREQAHQQGFVETLFGRRLYLKEINTRNAAQRQGAERAAINAPMQGTAADIVKRAMIAVDQALQASTLEARMVLQVHDELVLEVREDQIDAASSLLRQCMENAATLRVPLLVEIGVGDNWDQAH